MGDNRTCQQWAKVPLPFSPSPAWGRMSVRSSAGALCPWHSLHRCCCRINKGRGRREKAQRKRPGLRHVWSMERAEGTIDPGPATYCHYREMNTRFDLLKNCAGRGYLQSGLLDKTSRSSDKVAEVDEVTLIRAISEHVDVFKQYSTLGSYTHSNHVTQRWKTVNN